MITKRGDKGSQLTHQEMDTNFEELDVRTRAGWRDNIIEITLRNGPSEPQLSAFRGGIMLPAFVHTDVQSGYGNFHVDHDYKMGTALYPHIHWTTDCDMMGTVRWGIEYTLAKGHSQMAFGEPITVYVEQECDGTPYKHYVAEVSDQDAIPGLNIEPDTIILCRVFRDATHPNDTLDNQVFGICLDMHYQVAQAATPRKRPDFFLEA